MTGVKRHSWASALYERHKVHGFLWKCVDCDATVTSHDEPRGEPGEGRVVTVSDRNGNWSTGNKILKADCNLRIVEGVLRA